MWPSGGKEEALSAYMADQALPLIDTTRRGARFDVHGNTCFATVVLK